MNCNTNPIINSRAVTKMSSYQLATVFFLWVATEAQYQNVVSPIFVKNSGKCNDTLLDELLQNPWLIVRHNSGGFCNQLFGMYSSIPLARLIGTNIILGPMRTRKSFTAALSDTNDDMTVMLPYSSFFNISVHREHWARKNLQIVEYEKFVECVNLSAIVPLNKPRFFSFSDKDLLSMVNTSKCSLPFSPGVGVEVVGGHGMTSLYNHLQSGVNTRNRHLRQLADIHRSFVPNNMIK